MGAKSGFVSAPSGNTRRMSIIGFIIVGLIAGFLARAIVPGRDPMGLLATLVLGLVGSFVGGFLARAVSDNESATVGIIGSTIGAIIVLLVYRAVTSRRGHSSTK